MVKSILKSINVDKIANTHFNKSYLFFSWPFHPYYSKNFLKNYCLTIYLFKRISLQVLFHISVLPLAHFHFRICHAIMLFGIRLSNLGSVGNKYIQFMATFPYHNPTIATLWWNQYVEISFYWDFSYARARIMGKAIQSNNSSIIPPNGNAQIQGFFTYSPSEISSFANRSNVGITSWRR